MVWFDFARMIYHVQVTVQDDPGAVEQAPIPPRSPSPASSSATGGGRVSYSGGVGAAGAQALAAAAGAGAGLADAEADAAPAVEQRHTDANEPGRNDPCWCGSGKKYKRCHGA